MSTIALARTRSSRIRPHEESGVYYGVRLTTGALMDMSKGAPVDRIRQAAVNDNWPRLLVMLTFRTVTLTSQIYQVPTSS